MEGRGVASHRPKVSPSAEEYLLTLFRLESTGEQVGSSQLAKMFGVKAPSVTGMIRRLHQRGWVQYRRYRPPELTPEGRSVAVRLIRRHRLLETFLARVLDVPWDEVHEEVQILEHAVSDRLIERIDSQLGHPRFDPHGDPIPDENGEMPEHSLVPLPRLKEGESGRLKRVDNRSRHLMSVLKDMGVKDIGQFPGMPIERLEDSSSGKLAIKIGERQVDLDREVARLIWVEPDLDRT